MGIGRRIIAHDHHNPFRIINQIPPYNLMILNKKGFTFIELTVVIILIGLIMALTAPRFRQSILTDDLKTTVRRMVGLIKSLRNDAIRERKEYLLHFDIESNKYWIASTKMNEIEKAKAREKAVFLPASVRILDIWFKDTGKKMTGEAVIRFNKKGYVQESAIHLGSQDERKFTLLLSPFLGKVTVKTAYVDFEETGQ